LRGNTSRSALRRAVDRMLLTRLMNAPQAVQNGVAVLLGIAFFVVPLVLVAETVTLLREQSYEIDELRARAGKLAMIVAMKGDPQPLVNTGNSGLLIEAENMSIAKANLQSRISAIAQARGAAVSSSGSVPDIGDNGLLLIGLRADISGNNESIKGTLSDIESARPPMMVHEFILRSEGAPLADRPMTLTASIRLYEAARRPKVSAADVDSAQGAEKGAEPQ
jgi:Type II secretion system (T2SS), protein M subtype b